MPIRIPLPTFSRPHDNRRAAYIAAFVLLGAHSGAPSDPHVSWNRGPAERAIVALGTHFVVHQQDPARYLALINQPMHTLLADLRANGCQTWICSGGTTDFMRALVPLSYGVPPEQVIGSEITSDITADVTRAITRAITPESRTIDARPSSRQLVSAAPMFAAANATYEPRDSTSLRAAARDDFMAVRMRHDRETMFSPRPPDVPAR